MRRTSARQRTALHRHSPLPAPQTAAATPQLRANPEQKEGQAQSEAA
ncbi:hypothetical protein [Novosphingobium sp. SG707]|nr:hypothetical protein [Novosphingobium sp. SG707]